MYLIDRSYAYKFLFRGIHLILVKHHNKTFFGELHKFTGTHNSFIESNNWNHTQTKPLTITRHWDGEYNLAKSCILLQYANQIWL